MPGDKVSLRRLLQARRDQLDAVQRAALSARITERLLELPDVADAQCVLAYLTFGSEFDTAALVDRIRARHAALVLPKIDKAANRLRLYRIEDLATDLASGVWGIREPREDRCREVNKDEIDLVIVPGVGFTRAGARLGYGGGYYDGLLGDWPHRPPLVAPAFDVQIVEELPMEAWDVPVDVVVSESQVSRRATRAPAR